MLNSSRLTETKSVREPTRADPSAGQQVFASLFTPGWMLGMLLAMCLLMPSYQGCNGNVVRLSEAFVLEQGTAEEVYVRYLLVWPTLYGLIVFAGTLRLAWSRDPQKASFLWWGFAGLIVSHTALLVVTVAVSVMKGDEWSWDAFCDPLSLLWATASIGLPALLLVTYRYCGSWYDAAVWVQLVLAVLAAVCTTYVIPALLLAKSLLYGGKLMICCSVGLIVATIVQRLDGHRALTRARGGKFFAAEFEGHADVDGSGRVSMRLDRRLPVHRVMKAMKRHSSLCDDSVDATSRFA